MLDLEMNRVRELVGHVRGLWNLNLCEAKQLPGYKVITSSKATLCTQHAFIAFGLDVSCKFRMMGEQEVFKENGFTAKIVGWPDPPNLTVRKFALTYPSGNYYLTTEGHGMALRGKTLWDFADRGFDKRKVIVALEITGKGLK